MSTIYRAWRASFTRRWHTDPDLCHTTDPVSGHQQRVALLLLTLFPDASRDLIIGAITHDQGEAGPGDTPYDAKQANPALRAIVAALEEEELSAQRWPPFELGSADTKRLKLCDWLDAWLWALQHAPHITKREDWFRQFARMLETASELGVAAAVCDLVRSARGSL